MVDLLQAERDELRARVAELEARGRAMAGQDSSARLSPLAAPPDPGDRRRWWHRVWWLRDRDR